MLRLIKEAAVWVLPLFSFPFAFLAFSVAVDRVAAIATGLRPFLLGTLVSGTRGLLCTFFLALVTLT